jgi:hypothetical protein
MSFIKSFDQFANRKINEAVAKEKIKQIGAKQGEVSRWKVVLKSTQDTSSKRPEDLIKEILVDPEVNSDFATWWESIEPKTNTAPYTMICFVEFSRKDANVFRRDTVTAELIFKMYGKMDNGFIAMYDVKSATPILNNLQIGASQYKMIAWKHEDENTLRKHSSDGSSGALTWKKGDLIPTTGYLIDRDQSKVYTPAVVYNMQQAATQPVSAVGTSGAAGTSGAQVAPQPVQPQTQAPVQTGGASQTVSPTGKKFRFNII